MRYINFNIKIPIPSFIDKFIIIVIGLPLIFIQKPICRLLLIYWNKQEDSFRKRSILNTIDTTLNSDLKTSIKKWKTIYNEIK